MSRQHPRRRPWVVAAVVVAAVASALLLRLVLADAVAAAADGDRAVAAALGCVPWLLLGLSLPLARLLGRAEVLWGGLWLFVVGAPGLARRGGSGVVERALEQRAPGYLEGWLGAMGVALALLGGWYVWARAAGRLPD